MAGAQEKEHAEQEAADAESDLLPQAFSKVSYEGSSPSDNAASARSIGTHIARLRKWLAACLETEQAYGHLFYWSPIFLGTGAVMWFSLALTPSTLSIVATASISLIALYFTGHSRPVLRLTLIAVLLLLTGALLAAWQTERAQTVLLDTPVTTTVTGIVTGREADSNGRWRYTITLISTENPELKRAPAVVKLSALGRHSPLQFGETLKGRARLSPPSGPALPGLNDFAFDSYFNGNGAVGFLYGSPQSLGMDLTRQSGVAASLSQHLNALRSQITEHIRSILPGDTGAFAASMITDDRRAMSKETAEALRLAGLSHIIAISGLNMALAAGLFFVGIRAALSASQEVAHRFAVKKIAAAGALITVTGYYLISGFAVSAERAYIMMAIVLVAVLFGRPSISLRNVAMSALVILVISPSAVMGPGFQMSYAATLALVAGYSAWQKRGSGEPAFAGIPLLKPLVPVWKFVAGVFITSLIGGFSTALFSIEHFHRIAAWGLPANLLAMPVISFIVMPAGLLALILMPFGLDRLPLEIMGIGLDIVIAIAKWIASFDGDVVTGRIPTWLFLGLTIVFIAAAIFRSCLRYIMAGTALLLLVAHVLTPAPPQPDLVVFEDGALVGLLTDGNIATTRTRPPSFIFEQWQRALPAKNHLKPVISEKAAKMVKRDNARLTTEQIQEANRMLVSDIAASSHDRFLCREKRWCTARLKNGARIVVMEQRGLARAACDTADIVITTARLQWKNCWSGAQLMTAATLRRTGTLEIWLDPVDTRQIRVNSVFGINDRPWYIHRMYDWRSGAFVRGDGAVMKVEQ